MTTRPPIALGTELPKSSAHEEGSTQKGYLSTVLDDFSRYIIAWKLCSNIRAKDVTDTLDMTLAASDYDRATVQHKPRLLSDNGPN